MGPIEAYTPLFEKLDGTTTSALLSITAGLLTWAAWRFKYYTTEADRCLELAEATFAYQVDWRYTDRDADVTTEEAPPSLPQLVLAELDQFLWRSINPEKYWNNYYGPISETFHTAHAVKHIIPKAHRSAFECWLKAIIARAHAVAEVPDAEFRRRDEFDDTESWLAFVAPFRGEALPPEFLDPAFDYKPQLREELIKKFIENLDWKSNRYLRSPDQMLELGFDGVPYTFESGS
ncbi:hypothetical protein BZL42_01180 [Pseudomonas indica]|nr:hypothetical protein BZL42_01180 [Pseudomonas indica]